MQARILCASTRQATVLKKAPPLQPFMAAPYTPPGDFQIPEVLDAPSGQCDKCGHYFDLLKKVMSVAEAREMEWTAAEMKQRHTPDVR